MFAVIAAFFSSDVEVLRIVVKISLRSFEEIKL